MAKRLRVLIVEDNDASKELLKEILEPTGLTCLFASNGEQALLIFQHTPVIDLVLMDVRLPDTNGLELTRMMKNEKNSVPIIAQTANASQADKQDCFNAGCDEFMAKPFTAGRLQQLLLSLTLNDQAIRMADASVGNFPSGRADK